LNAAIIGLKFFFDVTLDREELMAKMRPVRVPERLPVVLSKEEVGRLIAACGNLKHQTALSLAYGTGLRASEVTALNGSEWVVYAKRPFAGPDAVLAYLSRYTHRVAISNRRLVSLDERGVSFRWKDYRAKGRTRQKTMTLAPEEFMRRFLLHVLPDGFHRIRHYGLLANVGRRENLARIRQLLAVSSPVNATNQIDESALPCVNSPTFVCPCCGAAMIVIETLVRGSSIRAPPDLRGDP
jgi:integrase